MPFIRVIDSESKIKIDINTVHIIAVRPGKDDVGTDLSLTTGGTYSVDNSVSSVRAYITKAETGAKKVIENPLDV